MGDTVQEIVEIAAIHVDNVREGYEEDPERAFLGINTKYESEIWGAVLGKDYDALVSDLATEGDVYTEKDYRDAEEKGIDTGTSRIIGKIGQAIALYYGGQAIGGAMGSSGGEVAGAEGGSEGVLSGAELEPVDIPASQTSSTGGSTIAESQAGVDTSGTNYLNTQEAPLSEATAQTPAPSATNAEMDAAITGGQKASSPGLIDSGLAFAKENPLITLGAGQLVSGVVGGIGTNINQNEAAEKKAQTEKELLAQKTEEERKALEARRAFVQGGSYYGAKVPVRAASKQPLRRPDGSLVYGPSGLINSGVK